MNSREEDELMMLSLFNGSMGSGLSLSGPATSSGPGFYLVVFLVILFGAVFIITPVPENSVLFLAGALAVNGQVSLEGILLASIAGAYIGYDLNYWTGRYFSLAVCRRFCPHILSPANIGRARALMEQFGPVSVVISRFIPAVNLPPFLAGMDSMDYGVYMAVNLAGAILWCGITVFLGYTLGSLDIIQNYVNLLFDLVIIIAVGGIGYAVTKIIWERRKNRMSLPG